MRTSRHHSRFNKWHPLIKLTRENASFFTRHNLRLLNSNFYGCVRANDICKIDVIEQPDLDRDQLRYLGIRTGCSKAGL
jgi:hypothetical protein